MRVPFSPHPHQHLLYVVFLIIAILTWVRWNINLLLICISFVARGGEHFVLCFLVIGLLPLKMFHLVELPTSSLVH
jgi:hypothetical protein